jgi:hypothetical protein
VEDGVKLDGQRFAETLDRLVSDSEFREALRTRPAEMLPQMGIEIEDPKRAHLVAERLAHGGDKAELAMLPNSAIAVTAVEVSVEAVTVALADKQVEEATFRIQQDNVERMRQQLAKSKRV